MPPIDFIVPTYNRPDHLQRCLTSLVNQSHPISAIYVGVKESDATSYKVISDFSTNRSIMAVKAEGTGVIGSMNACLRRCTADLIGLADDDVELPISWLNSMLAHLRRHPLAIAAGGRDMLMDYPAMRRDEKLMNDVGRLKWFGRVSGNHHRGAGKARQVDILRGSNILFRGNFLREVGFDTDLAGSGAQVHWELSLGLQAKQRGYHMIYDPEVLVTHHVAPRMDSDTLHRGIFDRSATSNIAYNETSIALRHARGYHRVTMLLWQALIGTPICPGLARVLPSMLRNEETAMTKFQATMAGRLKAITGR